MRREQLGNPCPPCGSQESGLAGEDTYFPMSHHDMDIISSTMHGRTLIELVALQ